MERGLIVLATVLAPAPLLVLAGLALASRSLGPAGGSDRSIAFSSLALLAGIALAIVGGAACGLVALRLPGSLPLRVVLATDVAAFVAGLVLWARLLAPTPVLDYGARQPTLDVEVRVAEAALAEAALADVSLADVSLADVVSIDFVGGEDLDLPHPELARRADGYAILPWETNLLRVDKWDVRVLLRDAPALFRLGLPRRPEGATDWSAWIRPTQEAGAPPPPGGVELRFRFRLTALGAGSGSEPVPPTPR